MLVSKSFLYDRYFLLKNLFYWKVNGKKIKSKSIFFQLEHVKHRVGHFWLTQACHGYLCSRLVTVNEFKNWTLEYPLTEYASKIWLLSEWALKSSERAWTLKNIMNLHIQASLMVTAMKMKSAGDLQRTLILTFNLFLIRTWSSAWLT